MRRILLLLVAAAAGCGGDDAAVTCSLGDRGGTYLMRFRGRAGGTCGPIPDTIQRFGLMGSGNCEQLAPDELSADECRLDRSTVCIDNGVRIDSVGYSTDVTGDGGRLEGVLTMTVRGDFSSCVSTYDVTATRQ